MRDFLFARERVGAASELSWSESLEVGMADSRLLTPPNEDLASRLMQPHAAPKLWRPGSDRSNILILRNIIGGTSQPPHHLRPGLSVASCSMKQLSTRLPRHAHGATDKLAYHECSMGVKNKY